MKCAHLLISGKVQGVWYRASTQQKAQALGLCGWVRNLTDGRVEALTEGPADALDALIAWAHDGPPAARVEAVTVRWNEPSGAFNDFEVRPSATVDGSHAN